MINPCLVSSESPARTERTVRSLSLLQSSLPGCPTFHVYAPGILQASQSQKFPRPLVLCYLEVLPPLVACQLRMIPYPTMPEPLFFFCPCGAPHPKMSQPRLLTRRSRRVCPVDFWVSASCAA